MDNFLKKIAIGIDAFLLAVSMYWSQDGFNFSVAGDAGGGDMAAIIGWGLAISVSVIQFVFSTNYKELNASLITFGVLAYCYSIYTNFQGILHFQGEEANKVGAFVLAFVMDGVPEPLIAWGLGESLSGDFVGNVIKAMFGDKSKGQSVYRPQQHKQNVGQNFQQRPNKSNYKPMHKPGHKPGHTDFPMPSFMEAMNSLQDDRKTDD